MDEKTVSHLKRTIVVKMNNIHLGHVIMQKKAK